MMQEESYALQEAQKQVNRYKKTGAKHLSLSNLYITSEELQHLIQQNLEFFQSIEKLQLTECSIKNLPPEIGKLTSLEKLVLTECSIENLPPEIGKLTNLKKLVLVECPIENLPPEIGELELESLKLVACDSLASLPIEIIKLKKLKKLRLSNCPIASLPPEIEQLTSLEKLDFSYCNLRTIPESLLRIPGLEIDISRNPIAVYEMIRLQNIINAMPPGSRPLVHFDITHANGQEQDVEVVLGVLLNAKYKQEQEPEDLKNKAIATLNQYPQLRQFVKKLGETKSYQTTSVEGLRGYAELLIPIITSNDKVILDQMEEIALFRNDSCGDNIVIGLLDMHEAKKFYSINKKISEMTPPELFDVFKNTVIFENLYLFTNQEMAKKGIKEEAVEEYLSLLNNIKEPLKMKDLPDTAMLYMTTAKIGTDENVIENFLEKYSTKKEIDQEKIQQAVAEYLVKNYTTEILCNEFFGKELQDINEEYSAQIIPQLETLTCYLNTAGEHSTEYLEQHIKINEIKANRLKELAGAIKNRMSSKEFQVYLDTEKPISEMEKTEERKI